MNKQMIPKLLGLVALLSAQLVFTSAPAQAALPIDVNPLSAGVSSTCAIRAADDLYCVGANTFGQLGNGTLISTTEPQKVVGISKVSSVSVGSTSACAVTQSGALYCWGDNSSGQLGIGNTDGKTVATLVSSLTNVSQVSVGDNFACALATSGTLSCWGANDAGQLTSGTKASSSTPVVVNQLPTGVSKVVASGKRVCVLAADIYCWGDFASFVFPGELRNWVPTKLPGSSGATSLELGSDFGCFTLASSVSCWGANDHGQLGNGTKTQSATPVSVSGLGGVRELATGDHFACATDTNGDTFCWGQNQAGQLALSAGDDQVTRIPTGAPKSAAMDAGLNNVCFLKLDGAISCFGDSTSGQSGFLLASSKPLANILITTAAKVSSGLNTTCVVENSGSLKCWGSVLPIVPATLKFSEVSVGVSSACAVSTTKKVFCWGTNSSGQLGDNTSRSSAQLVEALVPASNLVSVAVGNRHACAITADGLAYCWGDNSRQQLGSAGTDSKAPRAVPGIGTASAISVGDYHSCAQLTGGTVTCWGDNTKKQINTSATSQLAPTSLVLFNPISKVSLGSYNTCLLDTSKSIKCIGDNTKKQSPASLVGSYVDLSSGANTVCAVKTDESVICFGAAESGKLGSVTVDSSTPVTIADLRSAKVSVGAQHVCAIDATGNLRCWGSNTFGQLTSSFGFPEAFAEVLVSITGPISVGDSLSVSTASQETNAAKSFAWKRASTPDGFLSTLSSQTSNTYWISSLDLGRYFAVEVKQSKWGITSNSYQSKLVGPIVPATRLLQTPVPQILGVNKVGKILTVSAGRWDAGVSFSYQWYRGKTAIKGENKIRYILKTADLGKQLYVSVTGFKSGLKKVTKSSNKTLKVVR